MWLYESHCVHVCACIMHGCVCECLCVGYLGVKVTLITCTHLTMIPAYPCSPTSSLSSILPSLHWTLTGLLSFPCGCRPLSSSGCWHVLFPLSSVLVSLFPYMALSRHSILNLNTSSLEISPWPPNRCAYLCFLHCSYNGE